MANTKSPAPPQKRGHETLRLCLVTPPMMLDGSSAVSFSAVEAAIAEHLDTSDTYGTAIADWLGRTQSYLEGTDKLTKPPRLSRFVHKVGEALKHKRTQVDRAAQALHEALHKTLHGERAQLQAQQRKQKDAQRDWASVRAAAQRNRWLQERERDSQEQTAAFRCYRYSQLYCIRLFFLKHFLRGYGFADQVVT